MTSSTNFPGTAAHFGTWRGAQDDFGGLEDGFVVALTTDLQWAFYAIDQSGTAIAVSGATYLGGSGVDGVTAIAVGDSLSGFNLYVAGGTSSGDFPGTTGGAQAVNGGGSEDGLVGKLALEPDYSFSPVAPVTVAPGGSGSTTVTVSSLNGLNQEVKLEVFTQPIGGPVLPTGVTASVENVLPPVNGSTSTTLTFDVAPFVTPSTYTLWLSGLAGTPVMHSTPVVLNVIATFGSVATLITTLNTVGCIDNSGIAVALTGKLAKARALNQVGQRPNAINALNALQNQLRAQNGKHVATRCMLGGVTFDSAAALISDVQGLIGNLTISASKPE